MNKLPDFHHARPIETIRPPKARKLAHTLEAIGLGSSNEPMRVTVIPAQPPEEPAAELARVVGGLVARHGLGTVIDAAWEAAARGFKPKEGCR